MVARRRASEQRRSEQGKEGRSSARRPKKKGQKTLPDPSDHPESTTRFVQPYEATKAYLCPGCRQDIPKGQGHLVAVPPDDPDLRRHWHRGCWNNRKSRR
jgi:hypothetical protein